MSVSVAGLTWGRSGGANSFWCILITGCISRCSCTHTTALHPTLPHHQVVWKQGPQQHANYGSEILKQNTKTAIYLNTITFSKSKTFIKKTPLKKLHIPHKHCTGSTVIPFQAEIFPLSMIRSLHNAAAASVALAWYLITWATPPSFMGFTSLFWLNFLFSPRTKLDHSPCP